MSNKSAVSKSATKVVEKFESSQPKAYLFMDQLEVDVTGTIVMMIGSVWDVNAITGRYLSTDFVVSDSKVSTQFPEAKKGGIYNVKNFVVLPNKDEFWIFKPHMFMLEFDGETIARKVSADLHDYLRYPFQLMDFDKIKLANNKYLIDVAWMVTLWGGLGDVLDKRKTKHIGMCVLVLTAMSVKNYNNKLYLSSSSSTVMYDHDDIPCLQELKTESMSAHALLFTSPFQINNIYISDRCPQPPKQYSNLPLKGVTRQNGKRLCEACNRIVDYPIFRYRLEVVVVDDTTHTVIVMFNDTTIELVKCSTESHMAADNEGAEVDDSNLPTTIRNLIGTTYILEIKSYTYYEYDTFESFTCWKINPRELAEDAASSSTSTLTVDDAAPPMKRLARHPTVCTPSKPNEEKKKRA
nr:hypothetical protein [Tanacetum cinerariifolium]